MRATPLLVALLLTACGARPPEKKIVAQPDNATKDQRIEALEQRVGALEGKLDRVSRVAVMAAERTMDKPTESVPNIDQERRIHALEADRDFEKTRPPTH